MKRITRTLAAGCIALSLALGGSACTPLEEGFQEGVSTGVSAALAALIEAPIQAALDRYFNEE